MYRTSSRDLCLVVSRRHRPLRIAGLWSTPKFCLHDNATLCYTYACYPSVWLFLHVSGDKASILPKRLTMSTLLTHRQNKAKFNKVVEGGVSQNRRFVFQPSAAYYVAISEHGWLGSRVVSVLDSGAEGPVFKSQPRRCRVTVLGKLFTPIVPLFTKQRNW